MSRAVLAGLSGAGPVGDAATMVAVMREDAGDCEKSSGHA